MDPVTKKKGFYERAGIDDLAQFYALRYASKAVLQPDYFDSINRFDIRWARTMWIYDNVRRGSTLLDLGCGAGVLALLKRKGVRVIGVDLSRECARVACQNGYDSAYAADLTHLPFAAGTFDYVVSLDVMGHVEFPLKDAVLAEIKRVLKPDGVTMHGIECMNREKLKDYEEMTEEELRKFVAIDGHVGMEDEEANAARFRSFFAHVQTAPRFVVCQSHEEFLKQSDDYGRAYCEPDFLDYLRRMSFKERRAFNMAMGYVFDKISASGLRLPKSEFLFLKAANRPLGSFYNEHRDRTDFSPAQNFGGDYEHYLDRWPHATFDSGWYEAECFPPIARWMSERAAIRFEAASLSTIRIKLQSGLPWLETKPLGLTFSLNGHLAGEFSLSRYGWVEVEIDVHAVALPVKQVNPKEFELEIRANQVWQPNLHDSQSTDDRLLSVAVCNIEILP